MRLPGTDTPATRCWSVGDLLADSLLVDDGRLAARTGLAPVIAVMTFPYYWHTMPRRCANRLA